MRETEKEKGGEGGRRRREAIVSSVTSGYCPQNGPIDIFLSIAVTSGRSCSPVIRNASRARGLRHSLYYFCLGSGCLAKGRAQETVANSRDVCSNLKHGSAGRVRAMSRSASGSPEVKIIKSVCLSQRVITVITIAASNDLAVERTTRVSRRINDTREEAARYDEGGSESGESRDTPLGIIFAGSPRIARSLSRIYRAALITQRLRTSERDRERERGKESSRGAA